MQLYRPSAAVRRQWSLTFLFALLTVVAMTCAAGRYLGIDGAFSAFNCLLLFWMGTATIRRGLRGQDSWPSFAVIFGVVLIALSANYAALLGVMIFYR